MTWAQDRTGLDVADNPGEMRHLINHVYICCKDSRIMLSMISFCVWKVLFICYLNNVFIKGLYRSKHIHYVQSLRVCKICKTYFEKGLHQSCIYLIQNTVKSVISWNFVSILKTVVCFNIFSNVIYSGDGKAEFLASHYFSLQYHMILMSLLVIRQYFFSRLCPYLDLKLK